MSFAVPSNGFRLEGAALRNSYAAGRDVSGAVTSLEARVTTLMALKAKADVIAGTSGISMGSLGAVGIITMRDGKPSFEVEEGAIEITYPVGSRTETLTRVAATAEGAFLSVYDGVNLLGGGLATGTLQLNFAPAVVAPRSLRIVATLAGPGSRIGYISLSWV